MRKYLIERSLPGIGRASAAELRDAAEASNEALARLAPDVQWLESFVTDDATVCVYLAAGEEILREHAQLSGFPASRILEVRGVIDPATAGAPTSGAANVSARTRSPATRSGARAQRATKVVGLAGAIVALGLGLGACQAAAPREKLYLDVHHVEPGVKLGDVAAAHLKDVAIQSARGVTYERYWVDETSGTIYCLVRAPSAAAAADVHRDAHGLLAQEIHEVQEGILPEDATGSRLFMDTHDVAPGLHAEDVAAAHRKDLAAQGAHGVRFLEYWVDETSGRVHCLAEAPSADALIATHKEAHGLLPQKVVEVVAGR